MVVWAKRSVCRGMRWLLCTLVPKPEIVRTTRPNEGKLLVALKPGISVAINVLESRWSSGDECKYGGGAKA